jgi:hypothetical protein
MLDLQQSSFLQIKDTKSHDFELTQTLFTKDIICVSYGENTLYLLLKQGDDTKPLKLDNVTEEIHATVLDAWMNCAPGLTRIVI